MKKILNKRFSVVAGNWFAFLLLAMVTLPANAASVRDVAPTAADAPVMLDAENPEFGNFASFSSLPANRLIASIANVGEVMYFGLAAEHNIDGDPYSNVSASRYNFRVRRINADGSADIVHGPFSIDNNNANANSWIQSEFGVYDVTATQGSELIYVFRPDQPGDYSIEFSDNLARNNNRVLIPFWDFTVTDAGGDVIDGRVWSRSWSFRTPPVTGG